MNPTDPTKPPRSSLRAWLQHRTKTSWGTYFTHGPVLMFQLFLLHMQGLSDAQWLEDQRCCPNVPHLSQFLCNWETWRRYVSWVAQRVAEVLVPSNPLNFWTKVSSIGTNTFGIRGPHFCGVFRHGAKATVQPWEAPPRKTRCPWPCKRSTSLGCAEKCLEKLEIFTRNTR